MKNRIEVLLDELLKTLEEENALLKKGITSSNLADKLEEINEKKTHLIDELNKFEKKEFTPFKEKIEKIDELNGRNALLLLNNMDILESTIEAALPKEFVNTYSKDGKLISQPNVFRKKV